MDNSASTSSGQDQSRDSAQDSMVHSYASIVASPTREVPRNSENTHPGSTQRRPRPANRRTDGSLMASTRLSPDIRGDHQMGGRRPTIGRRLSTKGRPHRGQEFSVDDDSQEMEEHLARQRQQARLASGSMSTGTSTVRRRPAAAIPRLPTLDSSHELDDDQQQQQQQRGPSRHRQGSVDRYRSYRSQRQRSVSPDLLTRSYTWESPAWGEEDIEQIHGARGTENADNVRTPKIGLNDDMDGEEEEEEAEEEEEEEEEEASDAESFTLKDRQDAINETHPFGIRIWKPALYKKSRSVEKGAEGDIHSAPGGNVSGWLFLCNFFWTLLFGWWLALVALFCALVCLLFGMGKTSRKYGRVLLGLSRYILYPFGKYVKIIQEEAYAEEDEGEGRSIGEYEQWQNGDLEDGHLFFGPVRSLIGRRRVSVDSEDAETTSLLGRRTRRRAATNDNLPQPKRRLFGRGQWNLGRVLYFIMFYLAITPSLLLVSGICWLLVFSIPMGRVTYLLFDQLRRRPLALEFHSERGVTRQPDAPPSSILVCTYRAVGPKYWKFTVDGTNIILINLLAVVAFVIFDYWVLFVVLHLENFLTNTIFIFCLAIFSIMPLAYFIGQAVASISAQSTMGVGAAINAFFSTMVEVFLYCVALNDGKAQLVEGSVIGSIFAGILLLPGISMCFGAIKRKTQRFNVQSAGVTSTMLLFAVIGAFGPTLFYQIYGAHELSCHQCNNKDLESGDPDCQRCFYTQVPSLNDPFYEQAVRPFIYLAAVLLFFSYIIGLFFTLRTHAATIWVNDAEDKKHEKVDTHGDHRPSIAHGASHHRSSIIDYGGTTISRQVTRDAQHQDLTRSEIRDSKLYKQILGHSLKQAGVQSPTLEAVDRKKGKHHEGSFDSSGSTAAAGHAESAQLLRNPIQGLSEEQNHVIARQMAEMVATATTVATRDVVQQQQLYKIQSSQGQPHHGASHSNQLARTTTATGGAADESRAAAATATATADTSAAGGGHDAPNWSRTKSYLILFVATIAYAVIAEILVRTVDAVLENSDIDEKFLGITIFALVPNTTEFLNAISFAMNGNIALSMEIGSAYALQVCLLQIPALVLFSAVIGNFISPAEMNSHTFSLIFPQWDMVTTILCVFLLSYMYGEGKSNYFKGSILLLSYLVVLAGFYLAGFDVVDVIRPNDGVLFPKGTLTRYRTMGGGRRSSTVFRS